MSSAAVIQARFIGKELGRDGFAETGRAAETSGLGGTKGEAVETLSLPGIGETLSLAGGISRLRNRISFRIRLNAGFPQTGCVPVSPPRELYLLSQQGFPLLFFSKRQHF
jgi:hypothetical protein